MKEYACTKCMWVGEKPENEKCPECSAEIEYVRTGNVWDGYEGYNWNKK